MNIESVNIGSPDKNVVILQSFFLTFKKKKLTYIYLSMSNLKSVK